MKTKILKLFGAAMSALFLCSKSQAAPGSIVVDTMMPVPAAAAYSSTFSLRTGGMDWASAQVVLTSVTSPAATFTDGRASTATLTVVSFTGLSTATATAQLTVSSYTALTRQCVSGGGGGGAGSFNTCEGVDWTAGVSSATTACSLAAAINSYNVIVATCGWSVNNNVVYTTATAPGAAWNNFQIASSSAATTVSHLISSSTLGGVYIGAMTGGSDNGTFTINGKKFVANTDFYPITSTAQTATNIATAITNSSTTTGVVASAGNLAVVFATSTIVGTGTTYAIATSTQAALTISPYTSSSTAASGQMFGGANSSYVLNTSTINVAGNNFGLGQGVILSTAGNVGITPLIVGPTYYVITNSALGTGNIELATTQANALNNVPIVLTSSPTPTTTDTFTLTPSALAGTPGIQWVVSNDNVNWTAYTLTPFNVAVGSTTYPSYTTGGNINSYDFGHMNYGFLGLNFTAPTSGAVNIKAKIIGKGE